MQDAGCEMLDAEYWERPSSGDDPHALAAWVKKM
jgi:hypothetical protein